ncbi:N-acetylglutaminylglutamine amidotransferase [Thiorhodovibrio frisius]|uniref:asparagine synthase (glutamine-hydrolyzing) n=1 Tax=Thiorhodovibrio frisius TaxID=631362 RepID=H8Z3V1_9GAMM|nr:N-acetylglutaminylglutamine amidotransferase [Thiorhodovibrio frisius]EIC21103.1 asparagine synthase, glutamine-hydrolyzing [Thiorhodovibrio frisius]WPL22163.1 Asparagine synthetase [glutamine-hydrolyzing] 1 [Thiorhodovibrio frisius]
MCGICGELRFDGAPVELGRIARMMERLAPRGPDHGGSYSDGALAFGHRRLSIIDLSVRANQPMVDQRLGLALVFNGTIYNYPELRTQLRGLGYDFFSDGDTEVILKAWHAWGEDCVARFDGMFAFALWDANRRVLFLARDRFGIKPLYWTRNDQAFRFASNSQALVAGGAVDTAIDPVALHHLFTLHAVVPAPRTVLKGLRKLEPAHWLMIEADGRERSGCYWRLNATREPVARSESEWVDAVHERLMQSVRKRLEIADVPVGVLLSGGLDSSLLVALLAEAGARDLMTFSVGFEDTPEEAGSEFVFSDQVVARYDTRHHRFLVPNDEVLRRLPEAVDAMAEPMFGQDAVAFYLLAEQVSREIKVVQSGQGADEVFGGYFWYPRIAAETQGTPVERLRQHYFDRDHAEYLRLVTQAYAGADHTEALLAERLAEPEADEVIDAVLRLDVTTLIVDDPVKRVDNMTMAWGLEARVPFLDHHLVELAARCPPELKLREGGKFLLKRVARGRLPDAVIDRPKGYFPMPALKYVRGEFLGFMRDILNSQTCRERGLYQRTMVDQLLAAPDQHHTRIQGSKLWQLALLEYWLQRHL